MDNYLPKYKSGEEALIVNISSIAGVQGFAVIPVYTGTKFAVHGMTLAWGHEYHYNRTKVRVIGICPGVTETPLVTEITGKTLGDAYEARLHDDLSHLPTQA